eukprot:356791-Chlamydomonas_euryale.AAC.7
MASQGHDLGRRGIRAASCSSCWHHNRQAAVRGPWQRVLWAALRVCWQSIAMSHTCMCAMGCPAWLSVGRLNSGLLAWYIVGARQPSGWHDACCVKGRDGRSHAHVIQAMNPPPPPHTHTHIHPVSHERLMNLPKP